MQASGYLVKEFYVSQQAAGNQTRYLLSLRRQGRRLRLFCRRKDKRTIQKQVGQHCQKTLTALDKDLDQVEASIQALIDSDEHLSQLFQEITSVPGIGKVTATEMIITTNEFKAFSSAKQYACYGGIVPFEHTSGSSIRGKSRLSHKANKAVKKLLHLAAMSAIRAKGKFRDYYTSNRVKL